MVRGLRDALSFEGLEVHGASTGREGIALARKLRPDIILLDLMLPDINGYDVCKAIRRHDPAVPVLMLTARSQETDKIRGFDVGADDYVTKPFGIGELVARINALLRRRDLAAPRVGQVIVVGALEVDLLRQQVRREGHTEALSYYETELLRLLWERQGQPVSRAEVLERVWGASAHPENRTVDNVVVKLRRKLEPDQKHPRHILTVYGQGYKLAR